MAATVTYKTHVLLAFPHYGETPTPICCWTHVPSTKELQAAIDGASKSYDQFVLCTPVNVLPGNYEQPEGSGYDGY